ncbi:hypothetical protein [Chondromyces crocatus]|uniref:Uncharacterized protein n=1 Tax=Chondromyces crocatus TaxID=52 RepID=A0A0K1EC55_CHOCO|nr:hypothetical protein [Chondromyces crocatus]AKT38143.1 uncharacterized protein CMC5_022860 [Chondromyces crocatus]
MRRRLLTLAARHPLTALCSLVLVVLLGAGALLAKTLGGDTTTEASDAGSPRAILGRVWFDTYPEKPRDEVQIAIFLPGGIGIFEKGSAFRSAFEVFEFERQGDKVALTFLHDRKSAESKFTVRDCDEKPPFSLCLDLQDPLRGPKRYYGFGSADDMAREVPWGSAVLKAAESRATAR